MSYIYQKIDYLCERVEQQLKRENIIITLTIHYDYLKHLFDIGFFHLGNNIDCFQSLGTWEEENIDVNKIVDCIRKIVREGYPKKKLKKINIGKFYLKNRCVCCGAPLTGLKCEYCETEYEVEP